MSVITTGNIKPLLRQGIQKVFGENYDRHTAQHTELFDRKESKKAFEIQQQVDGFGLAPVKNEGSGIAYDSQSTGFSPKYVNLAYAKGFIVTMEALEDEQYGLFFDKARKLSTSMQITQETVAANVYNRAFNSAYLMTDGDGVELLSTAHVRGPNDSSTYSNELATPAAFSEASLESMLIQIGNATDARGLNAAIKAEKLILPTALGFEAARVLNSTLQNDTANNAVNAIKNLGALPGGHCVNNYLNSATAWFIKTNAPSGMTYQSRKEVSFGQDEDFGTYDSRFKAIMRFAYGWSDPRGLYGSAGV
jgi:hypothetical protein